MVDMSSVETLRSGLMWIQDKGMEVNLKKPAAFIKWFDGYASIQSFAGKNPIHIQGIGGNIIICDRKYQPRIVAFPETGSGVGDRLGDLVIADHMGIEPDARVAVIGVHLHSLGTGEFFYRGPDGFSVLVIFRAG